MDDRSDHTSTPAATGLTVADIGALPEDMVIRHLIDGALFEVTPPPIRHQQVVSPGVGVVAVDAAVGSGAQASQYERFAIPEFRFVDPDADRVEVYRLTDSGYRRPVLYERGETVAASIVPDLSVAVDDLLLPA